jgi:predicted DsbA family dithiol-disulfide isomerase
MPDMRVIDVWADVLCPFTHAGLRRVVAERSARNVPVLLHVLAWPLEWVNGAPLDADFVAMEVQALRDTVAPELFAGFDPATFPTTSVPALALAAAAYERSPEVGEAVSLALRDAVFEQGLDVGTDAVLDRIAAGHGVGRPDGDAVVREQYDAGRRLGVVGSPYFVFDDHRWFCPSLDIHHEDGEFRIDLDRVAGAEFLRQIFG